MITSVSTVEIVTLLLNVFGLVTVLGGVWFLSSLSTTLRDIKDNHLPHIYEELKYLRQRLDRRD